MNIMNEVDFREYKKLAIDLTHKMENVKKEFDNIMTLKGNFELSERQIKEISEYENRLQNCIDYFNKY